MTRTAAALMLIVVPALACAQSIRTGGLENLALGTEAAASSSATAHDGKYGPPLAVDGNSNTRWATSGDAEPPQWFEITFAEPVTLSAIVLEQSSAETIYAVAERVELSFSEGEPVEVELEDTWAGQIIRFEPRETTSLRLTILSAHEPKTYFGIAELSVFHDPEQVVKTVMPPRRRWENPDLTAHGREAHPCVNKTPADVERAARNVERYPVLADYVAAQKARADEWLERSDEWLLQMLPEPGAAFAYGFTGCPICGERWGTWKGARCSWDNPDYSRNTAYHVEEVTREGERARIRVREATFLLGRAVVDGPPVDAHTLTSVVPHAYARPRGNRDPSPEADFFAGKLLTDEDGSARTTIRRVRDGQPTSIEVDSVEGFADGDVCYYHDVRPGDHAQVHTRASLIRTGDGLYRLEADTAVTIGGADTVQYRLDGGEWRTADPHIGRDATISGADIRIR